MHLSRNSLGNVKGNLTDIPNGAYFELPEKVIQFGTGVLLRGLPDYFIDKANKKGIFNGRVLLVKSTSSGDTESFTRQDNLYTLCVRGLEYGTKVEENIINASISRVLSATTHWHEILQKAEDPQIEIIISNTTEVGITPSQEIIGDAAPDSFPGKLLAFLYRRFKAFRGSSNSGLVIIPTELIPDNGKLLLRILLDMAANNNLEDEFRQWLQEHNYFCSSLVDRIVPGKWSPEMNQQLSNQLGYQDDLMIMAESYRLWAIESANPHVMEVLSFGQTDSGVVLAPDIFKFRELKLRLLNGSHTYCCGIAFLAGFGTVKQAMDDPRFAEYIRRLMWQEIIPALVDDQISAEEAQDFAGKVLDRFRNPFIAHPWYNITLQYASKMRMRNLNLLLRYVERKRSLPGLMVAGWAAHLLFMKSVPAADGKYYGEYNGQQYLLQDNQARLYSDAWKSPDTVVQEILSNQALWGMDLTLIPGFEEAVRYAIKSWQSEGFAGLAKEFAFD